MVRIILLSLLSLFLLSGCACLKEQKASPTPNKATSEAPEKVMKTEQVKVTPKSDELASTARTTQANPCPGNKSEYKGKTTLKGRASFTKGAQLMLGGIILDVGGLKEAQRWVNKTIQVTGDLCHYTCAPHEQCLVGGTIPSLRNLTIAEDPADP
jgi:hypothetical protein